MPYVSLPRSRIHYEEYGDGHPLLLLAPGGVRSETAFWRTARNGVPRPYPDPTRVFADGFRIIAMDQRNAGRSVGEVGADDGWHTYTQDQLGLMDALGIPRFHVMGACIGGPFGLNLAAAAPDRVTAVVMQATIGLDDHNREIFFDTFDAWAQELVASRPGVDPAVLEQVKHRMFGGDFVFGTSRDTVRGIRTPILVLEGDDEPHPAEISREVCRLAPGAILMTDWKGDANRDRYVEGIRRFMEAHVPV